MPLQPVAWSTAPYKIARVMFELGEVVLWLKVIDLHALDTATCKFMHIAVNTAFLAVLPNLAAILTVSVIGTIVFSALKPRKVS